VEGEIAHTRQLLGMLEAGAAPGGSAEAQLGLDAQSEDELEQMAYVVSHDLQQPLNVVGRFLDLLAEKDGGALSEQGREFLDHAMDGAANLQRMMDAMLRYARVNPKNRQLDRVDLNRVRDRIVDNLASEIAEAGAQVTSDELPTVTADETQMEQLFQNLLSNSLKFRDQEPLQVHISASDRPREWVLAFEDNGIGVDPTAGERIFQMFQRLHTQDEYPGTGIGLAVCRRIVAHHGGRIWVESRLGEGATFFVTLPKGRGQTTRGVS
jgi:light-regulated signal transduction histidine kinase (bacteriophytochrome)